MKYIILLMFGLVLFSGCIEDCMTSCLKRRVAVQEMCQVCEITQTSCESYCSGASDSPKSCYIDSGCVDTHMRVLCSSSGGFCNQTCSCMDLKIDCPGNDICCKNESYFVP
jgi:hypothetical protein